MSGKTAKKKARKERAAKTKPVANIEPLSQKVATYIDENIAFEDMDDFPNIKDIHQEDQLMLHRQQYYCTLRG